MDMSGDLDIRIPLQELRDLLEGIAPYTDIRCALAQIAELERLADLLEGGGEAEVINGEGDSK